MTNFSIWGWGYGGGIGVVMMLTIIMDGGGMEKVLLLLWSMRERVRWCYGTDIWLRDIWEYTIPYRCWLPPPPPPPKRVMRFCAVRREEENPCVRNAIVGCWKKKELVGLLASSSTYHHHLSRSSFSVGAWDWRNDCRFKVFSSLSFWKMRRDNGWSSSL